MTGELLEISKGLEVLVSVTGCLPPGHCNTDGSRVSAIVYAPLDTADADRNRVSDIVYILPHIVTADVNRVSYIVYVPHSH